MSSENTIDNEGWTTIVKKQRKITNPESKPLKYIYKWSSNISKKDTTLTSKEQELIKQEMIADPELNIFCECCQCYTISDVICRTFFGCGRCYCCVGDNPAFDDDEWIENCTVRVGTFYKYNNDYHYKKDKDFYKK